MNPNGEDANGFLKLDFSSDYNREEKSLRMGLLAKMLFNLQDVQGFEHPVTQMRGGKIESGYAELDLGKLLHTYDIEFQFVDPRGRAKGEAFDYQVTYPDGTIVCADAKCKLEGNEPNQVSLGNSLHEAAKQLPKSRPSVILVKVPQHWIETPGFYEKMGDETRRFFRGTRRVVSVVYYSIVLLNDRDVGFITCAKHMARFHHALGGDAEILAALRFGTAVNPGLFGRIGMIHHPTMGARTARRPADAFQHRAGRIVIVKVRG